LQFVSEAAVRIYYVSVVYLLASIVMLLLIIMHFL